MIKKKSKDKYTNNVRKLKSEQQEPYIKLGVNSGTLNTCR